MRRSKDGYLAAACRPEDAVHHIHKFSSERIYAGRILKGEKTCRPACATTDEVRVGHQFEDGKGAGYQCALVAACHRRRDDQVKRREFIAALALAARTQETEPN